MLSNIKTARQSLLWLTRHGKHCFVFLPLYYLVSLIVTVTRASNCVIKRNASTSLGVTLGTRAGFPERFSFVFLSMAPEEGQGLRTASPTARTRRWRAAPRRSLTSGPLPPPARRGPASLPHRPQRLTPGPAAPQAASERGGPDPGPAPPAPRALTSGRGRSGCLNSNGPPLNTL